MQQKWFVYSKTFQGLILTALVALLPMFGLSFGGEEQALFTQTADSVLQTALLLYSAYGRVSATTTTTLAP